MPVLARTRECWIGTPACTRSPDTAYELHPWSSTAGGRLDVALLGRWPRPRRTHLRRAQAPSRVRRTFLMMSSSSGWLFLPVPNGRILVMSRKRRGWGDPEADPACTREPGGVRSAARPATPEKGAGDRAQQERHHDHHDQGRVTCGHDPVDLDLVRVEHGEHDHQRYDGAGDQHPRLVFAARTPSAAPRRSGKRSPRSRAHRIVSLPLGVNSV